MSAHARRVLTHQQGQANGNGADADADASLPIPADPSFAAPVVGGYVVKKRVTIPAISIPPGEAIVCRVLEAIRVSEVEDSKFGAARVAQVEAPDGTVRVLIFNEVLHAALTKNYKGDAYVGGWFHIACLPGMKQGKRGQYRDYAVTEIEAPRSTDAAE